MILKKIICSAGLAICLITILTATHAFASVKYEENDPAITYAGTWSTLNDSNSSGGSYRHSNDASTPATATLTFTGTGVSWISDPWDDLGIARVYIDDALDATVDLYSATGKYQQVVYNKTGLSWGTHTLKIEVTGTKNSNSAGTWIDIDAFEVMPDNVVYLDNGRLKVGVRLDWGGAIYEIFYNGRSLVDNVDVGALIQFSVYDGNNINSPSEWNPVQAGDVYNNSNSVINYTQTNSEIYTKCQPLNWKSYNSKTDVYLEQWVRLLPDDIIEVEYKWTHFGDDYHAAVDQELPAFYVWDVYNRPMIYEGNAPWTNDPNVTQYDIGPAGAPSTRTTLGPALHTTEPWVAWVDSTDFGLLYAVPYNSEWGLENLIGGNYSAAAPWLDHQPGQVRTIKFYLAPGDYKLARAKVLRLIPQPTPVGTWNFNTDGNLEGWEMVNKLGRFSVSAGLLTTEIAGSNTYPDWVPYKDDNAWMHSPMIALDATQYNLIKIRMKTGTTATQASVWWITDSDLTWNQQKSKTFSIIPNDGGFRDYIIDVSNDPTWEGYIRAIKLYPAMGVTSGTTSIDSIILTAVPSLSLSVFPSTWDLGTVPAGSVTTMTETARLNVQNTGNVAETFNLQITDTGGAWFAANTVDGNIQPNTFVMSGLFSAPTDSGIAGSHFNTGNDDDVIHTDFPKVASAETFGNTSATTASGVGVAPNETRTLWLQFKAPSTTTTGNSQSITLTIGAIAQ